MISNFHTEHKKTIWNIRNNIKPSVYRLLTGIVVSANIDRSLN